MRNSRGCANGSFLNHAFCTICSYQNYTSVVKLVLYFYSELKGCKHNVKINSIYSIFQIFPLGVQRRFILEPIGFHVFLNDLFLWIYDADLQNSADNISSSSKDLDGLTTVEDTSGDPLEFLKSPAVFFEQKFEQKLR